VLGLNAKDNIGAMNPQFALKMVNIFPEPDKVTVRRGHESHAHTMTLDVESLMAWRGPSGVKLLAATDSQMYDVTAAGTAVASGTTTTGGRWQHVNFTTTAGHFLIMVNGEDAGRKYDGSTISANSVTGTGLTSTHLINVASHKSRLWFIEKNTMNAWYLPVDTIAGAAVKFPLGAVFKDGGSLVAMGTYSDDAGDGLDDFMAFISSTGELLLYAGTNPASANTWSLVGRYKTGKPLGMRCFENLGGDLLILTTKGVMSTKSILRYDRAQQDFASVSNNIDPLIQADARLYSANFGWQIKVYPNSEWLLVNVPAVEGVRQYQYVMNTLTGAWCKFDGMAANCWEHIDTQIYFGGNEGTVYEADTGYKDNGGNIQGQVKTAFNYFNAPGMQKLFGLVRPVFTATGNPVFAIDGNVDFEDVSPTGELSIAQINESYWETATWDTSTWGGTSRILSGWTTLNAIGMCLALNIKITTYGGACSINSFDLTGQSGGTI
jgi:hypothetical protein